MSSMKWTTKTLADALGITQTAVNAQLRFGHIRGHKAANGRWIIDEADPIAAYQAHRIESRHRLPIHIGDKFGYWTVIAEPDYISRHNVWVLCRCVCGKEKMVNLVALTRGRSRSCGCHRSDNQSAAQIAGKEQGHQLMKEFHRHHLSGKYLDKSTNRNSTTGHTGVSWSKAVGKYRAYITLDRRQIHLGSFDRIEDAIAARKAAEQKYFTDRQELVDKIKRERGGTTGGISVK